MTSQGLFECIFVNIPQESFNSRLKANGDETSTNLYVSNLPKNMNEAVSRQFMVVNTQP
jgi:hypothetical protein